MALERLLVPPPGPARRDLAAAIGFGLLAGCLVVVQALLLAHVIDGAFLGDRSLEELTAPLAWLALAAVAKAACGWLADALAARAAARVRLALRQRVLEDVQTAGPAFTRSRPAGALSTTVVSGVEATDAYVSQYLPQLALSVLVPLVVGTTVAWLDPLSALVLLATYPLIPLFMFLIGSHARVETRRQWLTLSRMRARVLDAIQGLPTLTVFGAAAREAAGVRDASERFRVVTMGVLRVAFLSALVLELLATLGVAIVAVEIGLRLLYARVAFGPALAVLVLAPDFYKPLRALGAAFHAGMAGKEAAAAIAPLLAERQPLDGADTATTRTGAPVLDAAGLAGAAVRFENVSLTYPGRTTPALEDVRFEMPPGTTTALVGRTGAGKSTLAEILLRFADPGRGAVHVGDVPLAAIDPDTWRSLVAWVPQRPHLFHGTLRDNLLLARPDASPAAIEEALAEAQAHDMVRTLPHGLDTPLGERGARLSGGQAQRLAIARAFLRDAPLLVLDEPTAQLDPGTEAALTRALHRLRRGRTVLLIAHRLSTVEAADQVIVLDAGRVVERGTHAGLVNAGGAYQRLVQACRGTA
ncbi:MAG TPA: thiol reductant ABC exporter subunit CydD [Gemmatimonadales bacterium]|nr:thiol reductant ABC exporter subunit CydD [Gemmatimonadales bacterium]